MFFCCLLLLLLLFFFFVCVCVFFCVCVCVFFCSVIFTERHRKTAMWKLFCVFSVMQYVFCRNCREAAHYGDCSPAHQTPGPSQVRLGGPGWHSVSQYTHYILAVPLHTHSLNLLFCPAVTACLYSSISLGHFVHSKQWHKCDVFAAHFLPWAVLFLS